jgi:GT2 family glycosyltransferase
LIYAIIPVRNRIESTILCLNDIFRQKVDDDQLVIVIDDGSTDGTRERVTELFPEVKILNGSGDLWWTGAVKLGIEYVLNISNSDTDWIVLMNNDIRLMDTEIISKLIVFAKRSPAPCLVSPISTSDIKLLNTIPSGKIIRSWFFNISQNVCMGRHVLPSATEEGVEVDLMTARCLVHPLRVFKKIGLYDDRRFPHYGGDDEFSQRAKRAGFKLYVLPEVKIFVDTTPRPKVTNRGYSALHYHLFDRRSSINLGAKWRFSLYVVPFCARPTYFIVACIKSILQSVAFLLGRRV